MMLLLNACACVEYSLLSCILATKPVRGICGVSCTMGGGGGGATDTGAATPRREAEGAAEKEWRAEEERNKRHCKGEKSNRRTEKSLWASRSVQEALLSNSFTHFQSEIFCAAFFKLGYGGVRLVLVAESTSSASVLSQKHKLKAAIDFCCHKAPHRQKTQEWQGDSLAAEISVVCKHLTSSSIWTDITQRLIKSPSELFVYI